MSLRDNKMTILRLLGEESEPITMPKLLGKLGKTFKERSVRRWLHLLTQDGAVQKIGQKRGTGYIAIGRNAGQKNNRSSCFSSASIQAIDMIRRPLFEREPVAYVDAWFDAYQPNVDFYLDSITRNRLYEAGRRADVHDPAGTYAHQIFNRLLIDLSYNSSRLEGNTYSLLDTQQLLLQGTTAEGKLDEEKIMILNHKEAIRYIVDNISKIEITRTVICTLHYLLSDGLVESSEAGKIRRHGVRIKGSVYIPFEDPKSLDCHFEKIVRKAALIQDPFEQSIFLLIHLSYLQAFIDVNKRTARLSANIALIKQNLVPLAFNDIQVDDYMSAMIVIYELQNVQPLVDLYVYSYLRTCAAYDSTVKAMGFDEVRVRYRQERRNIVREVILRGLVGSLMQEYVDAQAAQQVAESVKNAFVEDVLEDLQYMDESRLAGLGVTPQELQEWKSKQSS